MSVSSFPNAPTSSASASAEPVRPAEAEPDLLDHEYDGIREYDNPMPRWWVRIFWGSFVFAIGYGFHYHVSHNGVSVADAYAADVAEARALESKRALGETVSEDGLRKLMQDPAQMAEAKALFGQRCTPCHGENAQGVIGPNLTDDYWLHGDTLIEIHHTVSEGVADKGMPAWKAQLNPVQLRQLAALVGSFRGKHLAGKAPEGELVPAAH